ncbi:MAG: hypothetical protein WC479_11725, partial [Candidatus Izemoplasmatales bacterium]
MGGWEDAFDNAVGAALSMWDNATQGNYNPLAGPVEQQPADDGNWWDDVGAGIGNALGAVGQGIGTAWQQFTSPTPITDVQDWYNEPAGQSAQQRVDWEMQRRAQEGQTREMPIWEQAWQPIQQGLDWWNTNVQERMLGIPTQMGVDWNEQVPYIAAGLAMPWAGPAAATYGMGKDIFNKWQSGESITPDWNTAPEAWRQYKGSHEEPFPTYYGMMEMGVDPLNLLGTGAGTQALRRLPALKGATEAAMGLRSFEKLDPFSKVLGKGLQWFDAPETWRQGAKSINDYLTAMPYEQAAKEMQQAMDNPAKILEFWKPTSDTMAKRTVDLGSDLMTYTTLIAGDHDTAVTLNHALAYMGKSKGDIPDIVTNLLGDTLPRSKKFGEYAEILSRLDPKTIETMIPDNAQIAMMKGFDQGADAAKAIGGTRATLENAWRNFAGGYSTKEGWEAGMMNVPKPNAAQRWTNALKNIISTPYLALNPGYGMKNITNNLSSIVSIGANPGFKSTSALEKEVIEHLGFVPSRYKAGIVGKGVTEVEPMSLGGIYNKFNVSKLSNDAETNMGFNAAMNTVNWVADQLVGKADFTGVPEHLIPAIKNIMRKSHPGKFEAEVARLVQQPGAKDLVEEL